MNEFPEDPSLKIGKSDPAFYKAEDRPLILGGDGFIERPVAAGVDTGLNVKAKVRHKPRCITPLLPRSDKAEMRKKTYCFGRASAVSVVTAVSETKEDATIQQFLNHLVSSAKRPLLQQVILNQFVQLVFSKSAVDDPPTEKFGLSALQ
jgi:hypothetical protein